MREAVFFDLNRVGYQGGAEKYVRETGSWLAAAGVPVRYVGDFRLILKAFTWLGFLFGTIGFGECRKLLRELDAYPRTDPSARFPIEPLGLAGFVPFSKARRRMKGIIADSQAAFVKNELPDLLLFRSFARSARKRYCLVFTAIAYPEKGTFRSFVHNLCYLSPLYGRLLKGYDGLIVSNRADRELLVDRFGISEDRISLIPYGIDPAELEAKREAWKIPGLDPARKKVLFVGRLEEQKGIADLISVIEQRSGRDDAFQFLIIGDGPGRNRIEEAAARYGHVLYLGSQPQARVLSACAQADLALVPSHWETFCYVALEAQASGCPVIAYDIAGPDGIVRDGESGRLVPPFDRRALAEALDGSYAFDRRAFAERFSKERIVRAYKEILAR